MMRRHSIGLVAIILTGCVAEYDPEVFVLLPDLADPCGTLGAARAHASIETLEGEHFEVTSDACGRIGGEAVSGFTLTLDRVTYGYHRATLSILDDTDHELGRIERPFAAETPLVAPFAFADLPGWPTGSVHVVASCTEMALTVTSTLAARPSFAGTVACDAVIEVPRGPVEIEARTPCAIATSTTFVAPPDDFSVEPLALVFLPEECP